jgi:hypothetical protein
MTANPRLHRGLANDDALEVSRASDLEPYETVWSPKGQRKVRVPTLRAKLVDKNGKRGGADVPRLIFHTGVLAVTVMGCVLALTPATQGREKPLAATEQPFKPEKNPPGDIPDNQVFIEYSSPLGLENAIRHAGDGAVIALNAAARNSTIEAVVGDTGPGVAASDRERVLRRFVRPEASRSTPGTGLGLTLVKAIADLHDARIALADHEPGLQVTIIFQQGISPRN